MGGMLVAARVIMAIVEREAGQRARRAAGISAVVLAALFVGLAGLLFVLYALVLALTPYLTPAGAAALVGAAMILRHFQEARRDAPSGRSGRLDRHHGAEHAGQRSRPQARRQHRTAEHADGGAGRLDRRPDRRSETVTPAFPPRSAR
jgi:hypothetical protein